MFPFNLMLGPAAIAFFLIAVFIAPWGLLLFPVVLMHHICAQSRAIGLIYCGKNGFRLSKTENLLVSATMWLLVLSAAATFARPFGQLSQNMNSFSQMLPLEASIPFSTTFVLATAFMFLARGLFKNEWLPLPVSCLWLNLSLYVLLGSNPAMVYVWLFVPLFFHAAQHWAVAWDTQRKEQLSSESTGKWMQCAQMVLPVLAVTFFVLFLPLFLVEGSAMLAGKQFTLLPQGAGLMTLPLEFLLVVFYLHYLADRVVWKTKKKGASANV
jgi:hypothetical protein